ncbi:MAG: hypothetical protein LR015_01770 [Verrucomicrobia bacterium]|nr:hypothetical protein [Verrucomicrobiota bacterium]
MLISKTFQCCWAVGVYAVLFISGSLLAQTWEDMTPSVGIELNPSYRNVLVSAGERLYVIDANGGVRVTANGGQSFEVVDAMSGGGSLAEIGVFGLFRAGNYIYAALNNPAPGVSRLYRLPVGGNIWEPAALSGEALSGTGTTFPEYVTYDDDSGTYYFNSALGGVYASSDGLNWQARPGAPGLGSPASVLVAGGVVYSVRPLGGGPASSKDGGLTWSNANLGQIDGGFILPVRNSIVWIGSGVSSSSVAFYTKPGSTEWLQTPGLPPSMTNHSSDGELLFAPTGVGRIMVSATQGRQWHDVPTDGLSLGGSGIGSRGVMRVHRVGDYVFAVVTEVTSASFQQKGILYRLPLSAIDLRTPTQILRQPVAVSRTVGESAVLSVYAIGENLAFQWFKDGAPLAGQNAAVLQLYDLTLEDAGSYEVVVSGSRGTVTSSSRSINVLPVAAQGAPDPLFNAYLIRNNSVLNTGQRDYSSTVATRVLHFVSDEEIWVAGRFQNPANSSVVRVNSETGVRISALNPPHGGNTGAGATHSLFQEASGNLVLSKLNGEIVRFDNQGNRVGSGPFAVMQGSNVVVHALEPLPDGRFFVAGWFQRVADGSGNNPVDALNIVLLNPDGSIDPSFAPNANFSTFNTYIRALAYDPIHQQLYVGGAFENWPGLSFSAPALVRLNLDGSLDTTFQPPSGAAFNRISSLVVQPDGKLLYGSSWTGIGITAGRLLRNGSADPDWIPGGNGVNGVVHQVSMLPDGRIVVVGNLSSFNGTFRGHMLVLNADGTLDVNFNSGGLGARSDVGAVTVSPDGKWLYVAMRETLYNTVNGDIRVGTQGWSEILFRVALGSGGGSGTVTPRSFIDFDQFPGNWHYSDWMGWFYPDVDWTYQYPVGWIRLQSGGSEDGFYFFNSTLRRWVWSSADLFPGMWIPGEPARWVWPEFTRRNPRYFVFDLNTWVHPEDL